MADNERNEHRHEAPGHESHGHEQRGDEKKSAHASDSGHEGTDGVKADWKQKEQGGR